MVLIVTTAVGLWLGLTAPSTSPVTPRPPQAVTASAAANAAQPVVLIGDRT